MKREFSAVIERDSEGSHFANVPALRGCHTQARSLDKLHTRIEEAISLCLEIEGDTDEDPPEFIDLQRVTIEI